jgi:hypothetical protein
MILRERTSAGTPKIHFGIHKANILDPILAELDTSHRTIAYQTGHVYECYKTAINVELQKKKFEVRCSKLWTILLVEASQNMRNKHLSWTLMWHAEHHGIIPKDMFGGCKKHDSIKVSLNQ